MGRRKDLRLLAPVQHQEVPEDWWDPRKPDSFFRGAYRIGDDSFGGHLADAVLSLRQRTERECDMVEKIAEPPRGSVLVDCPCGFGRHTVGLGQRGYRGIGVDLDAVAIAHARRTARQLSLSDLLSFAVADARELPVRDDSVDLAVNMFFSFGFFSEDAENLRMLKEFSRVLRTTGTLLIHTDVNPDRIYQGIHHEKSPRGLRNGQRLFIEESYDPGTRRLSGTWKIRGRGIPSRCSAYSMRVYSHDEIRCLLRQAGFRDLRILTMGGKNISFEPLSPEVVYVAS